MRVNNETPGHVVVVTKGGCPIHIPFCNGENAHAICNALYQQMLLLGKRTDDDPEEPAFAVQGSNIDPIAFVLLTEVAGWYVSYGSASEAHAKAVERLADVTEKALDPDKGEDWRGE